MFLEDSTVGNGVLASTLPSGEDYPFRKRCAQHYLEMDISPKADVPGIGWGPWFTGAANEWGGHLLPPCQTCHRALSWLYWGWFST